MLADYCEQAVQQALVQICVRPGLPDRAASKSWSSSPADLCAAARLAALGAEEPTDDLVLALAAQLNKRLAGLSPAERFELPQAEAIDFLQAKR